MVTWAPATPACPELLRSRNREQEHSHVSSWSWITQVLEVKGFVLLSLQLEVNLELVCDPMGVSSGKLLLQTGDLDALALRITPCLRPKSFPPHFSQGSLPRKFCYIDFFCC